jgi:type I restriction enzyme, S subunit
MRPSGIQWLGDVPEHWEVSRIKYLCYVNDGNHGEEYPNESDYTSEENGVPFIRGGNLNNLTVTPTNMLYITKEKNDSMRKGNVHTNDILFVNRGDIGKLAVIPPEFNGANLNSQIAYLRTEGKIYFRYLMYFLCSQQIGNLIDSLKAGSVLTQFPIRDIINIAVPLPPESEQQEIGNWLDERIGAFIQLQAEAERAIELLQERRTALISAAVTGKIDVRGFASKEAVT